MVLKSIGITLFTSAIWFDIWNSHTSGASRDQNTMDLPPKQRWNLFRVGHPIDQYTDLLKHGYIIVV